MGTMIWNRKPKVAPADLAQALFHEFVVNASNISRKTLELSSAECARFDAKARLYTIASVPIALGAEEQSKSRYASVREEFELRVLPSSPTEEGLMVLENIKRAMRDLQSLLFPEDAPKEMSWARRWLLDIGVDETNPATLSLQALYWYDFHTTIVKAVRSFKLT